MICEDFLALCSIRLHLELLVGLPRRLQDEGSVYIEVPHWVQGVDKMRAWVDHLSAVFSLQPGEANTLNLDRFRFVLSRHDW